MSWRGSVSQAQSCCVLGLGLTARPQAHEAWVLNFCILGPHVLGPRILGPLLLGPHVLGPLILDPHDLGSWAPETRAFSLAHWPHCLADWINLECGQWGPGH